MWIERDDLEDLIARAVEAERTANEEKNRAQNYRETALRLKHQRDNSYEQNKKLRVQIEKMRNRMEVLLDERKKQ